MAGWRWLAPTVLAVPVEFLSDQEAAALGRYGGSVPQADLERFFFLDFTDRPVGRPPRPVSLPDGASRTG